MESFFKKNKIFLAILIGAIIISAGIYFGLRDSENKNQNYSVLKDNFISKTDNFKINNSECLAKPETIVTKVIDGDTIVVEGGYHIRLLSIDADETGFPCYQDAKTRLEELVLNKKIYLEKDKTDVDQYERCLRYVFLDNQNINLQLAKEGLVIARFYEPDIKHKSEIQFVEKTAIAEKIGCKWKNK